MIITLKNANFSDSNIGNLYSTYISSLTDNLVMDANLSMADYTTVSSTNHFTFKDIPVRPNTLYYAVPGIRVWFLDSAKNGISTLNIVESATAKYHFTTPANAEYISISIRKTNDDGTDVNPMNVVLLTVKNYQPSGTTVKLNTIAGSVLEKTTLTDIEYTPLVNNNHNTFMEVPVEAETVYYVRNGIRVWFLDSDKNTISTKNIYSTGIIRGQFKTVANTAYISIAIKNADNDGTAYTVDDATIVTVDSL